MPYPHELAVRVHQPSKYIRMRRQNGVFESGIDVIWGILKKSVGGARTEIQALRFDAKKFTPAKVRAWIDAHGGRGKGLVIEPATRLYERVKEVYAGNPKRKRSKRNPVLHADPYLDALHTHFPSKQQSSMFADISLLKYRGADRGKILHEMGNKYGLNARFAGWLIDQAEI